MVPDSSHYWLKNAQVPLALLSQGARAIAPPPNLESLVLLDVEIQSGWITQVVPAAAVETGPIPFVDLQHRQIWPCFVDMHTHLDKGHIWQRSPNPDGTFQSAIATVQQDIETYWDSADLYQRMEFGLKCSYVHGTKALRTHLDSPERIGELNWDVFKTLQEEWGDRLMLQAVSLVTLDYYLTPAGEKLADRVAELGGVLGGVAYMNPNLDSQLEHLLQLAQDRGLALDLHTDETGDPDSKTLHQVAQKAIQAQFPHQITCGHCCSLALQSPEFVHETLALVKEAGIGIVSLPTCNLYLQDRQLVQNSKSDPKLDPRPDSQKPSLQPYSRTPRWRGITLIHELRNCEIPVAIASDNCRDPFYSFGDHDGLETFIMAVRIAHLDQPYGDWPELITQVPAQLMGLHGVGQIGAQVPADLIIFEGRSFSELLSRPCASRTVIRDGSMVTGSLPSYTELDNLRD
ncbi:MAG: cytosine deaminase [Oscillatoriales cyanobacterium RM2_1_1]|nr:cytosine deaminase [Oscillatoriales cyanobacterium RM2_1_1]